MKSIIKVALRIILVVLFLQWANSSLTYINSTIFIFTTPAHSDSVLSSFITTAVYIVLGALVLLFLWRSTDKIVDFLAKGLNESTLVISTDNIDLIRVVTRVMGIYLIVTSIPYVFGILGGHYYWAQFYRNLGLRPLDDWQVWEIQRMIVYFVTLLFGLLLVLGSKQIMRALRYIWNAGNVKKDNNHGA